MKFDFNVSFDRLYRCLRDYVEKDDTEKMGLNLRAIANFENFRFWLIAQEQFSGGQTKTLHYSFVVQEKTGTQLLGNEIMQIQIPTSVVENVLETEPEPEKDEQQHMDWERKIIAHVMVSENLMCQMPESVLTKFHPYLTSAHEANELKEALDIQEQSSVTKLASSGPRRL